MKRNTSPKRRENAPKALLPEFIRNRNFELWRMYIGKKLLEKRGRCAILARRFGVESSLISDWFTLRRSMPPAVVVFSLLEEGGNLWPQ